MGRVRPVLGPNIARFWTKNDSQMVQIHCHALSGRFQKHRFVDQNRAKMTHLGPLKIVNVEGLMDPPKLMVDPEGKSMCILCITKSPLRVKTHRREPSLQREMGPRIPSHIPLPGTPNGGRFGDDP